MARYIDADKLLENVTKDHFNDWYDYDIFQYLVEEATTADVVPKSEVERLQSEVTTLLNDFAVATLKYEKAKAEVAREIFAEIETALNLCKCYGDSGIYYEHDIEAAIAELKKKYTGDQT